MTDFTWATETNFPPSGAAWGSQPLAVAPSGDYFIPSPASAPIKLPAENLNFILRSIGQNLPHTVASVAALRALPVPTSTQLVVLTPSNNGQVVNINLPSAAAFIGGTYYYDPSYNVVDNSSTAIRPSAIGGGSPGMWRLSGGPLFPMWDLIGDVVQNLPATGLDYSASFTIGGVGTSVEMANGGLNFRQQAVFTTGNLSTSMYFGDQIDLDATIRFTYTNAGSALAGLIQTYASFARNSGTGGVIGAGFAKFPFPMPAGALTVENELPIKLRYTVSSGDIATGTLTFALFAHADIFGSITTTATVDAINWRIQLRRP